MNCLCPAACQQCRGHWTEGKGAAGFARYKEPSKREGQAGMGLWWRGHGPKLGNRPGWTGRHGRGLERWGKWDFVHVVNNFEVWKRLVMVTRKKFLLSLTEMLTLPSFTQLRGKGYEAQAGKMYCSAYCSNWQLSITMRDAASLRVTDVWCSEVPQICSNLGNNM